MESVKTGMYPGCVPGKRARTFTYLSDNRWSPSSEIFRSQWQRTKPVTFQNENTVHQFSVDNFFHLPAEIRLMIYRHYLIHDKPLSSNPLDAKNDGTKAFQHQAINLLRTCQQVFNEAAPIYYENTIKIKVNIVGSFTIFRSVVMVPIDWPAGWDSVTRETLAKTASGTLEEDSAMVRRFPKFQIDFANNDSVQFRVFFACSALKELLYDKEVSINFGPNPQYGTLRACQALRCRRFSISGHDHPDITTVVQGPNVAENRDLWVQWCTFDRFLQKAAAGNKLRFIRGSWELLLLEFVQKSLVQFRRKTFFRYLSELYEKVRNLAIERLLNDTTIIDRHTQMAQFNQVARLAQAEIADRCTCHPRVRRANP